MCCPIRSQQVLAFVDGERVDKKEEPPFIFGGECQINYHWLLHVGKY